MPTSKTTVDGIFLSLIAETGRSVLPQDIKEAKAALLALLEGEAGTYYVVRNRKLEVTGPYVAMDAIPVEVVRELLNG